MERITADEKYGYAVSTRRIPEELDRLGEYEDTGLSPKEVARLREDARWVSVEDDAPYADTDYKVLTVAFIPSGDDYWVPSTDDGRMVVTHYRPLPQGPEDGREE
jgi:hypothetical protein